MAQSTVADRSNRDRTYSITELCREFDVTPRTLRFYEQKGRVPESAEHEDDDSGHENSEVIDRGKVHRDASVGWLSRGKSTLARRPAQQWR